MASCWALGNSEVGGPRPCGNWIFADRNRNVSIAQFLAPECIQTGGKLEWVLNFPTYVTEADDFFNCLESTNQLIDANQLEDRSIARLYKQLSHAAMYTLAASDLNIFSNIASTRAAKYKFDITQMRRLMVKGVVSIGRSLFTHYLGEFNDPGDIISIAEKWAIISSDEEVDWEYLQYVMGASVINAPVSPERIWEERVIIDPIARMHKREYHYHDSKSGAIVTTRIRGQNTSGILDCPVRRFSTREFTSVKTVWGREGSTLPPGVFLQQANRIYDNAIGSRRDIKWAGVIHPSGRFERPHISIYVHPRDPKDCVSIVTPDGVIYLSNLMVEVALHMLAMFRNICGYEIPMPRTLLPFAPMCELFRHVFYVVKRMFEGSPTYFYTESIIDWMLYMYYTGTVPKAVRQLADVDSADLSTTKEAWNFWCRWRALIEFDPAVVTVIRSSREFNREFYGKVYISARNYNSLKSQGGLFTSDTCVVMDPKVFKKKVSNRNYLLQRGYNLNDLNLHPGDIKIPTLASPWNSDEFKNYVLPEVVRNAMPAGNENKYYTLVRLGVFTSTPAVKSGINADYISENESLSSELLSWGSQSSDNGSALEAEEVFTPESVSSRITKDLLSRYAERKNKEKKEARLVGVKDHFAETEIPDKDCPSPFTKQDSEVETGEPVFSEPVFVDGYRSDDSVVVTQVDEGDSVGAVTSGSISELPLILADEEGDQALDLIESEGE
jgi:hypothetical protein